MSIKFSGTRSRSNGVIDAIAKQLRLMDLKPVVKITARFNPFHENVSSIREFLYYLSGPKVRATNVACMLKSEIACDNSAPTVACNFESGKKLILKSANLTTLELLKIFNKHITYHIKPVENTEIVTTNKGKKFKK